jgi:hypothetical protein
MGILNHIPRRQVISATERVQEEAAELAALLPAFWLHMTRRCAVSMPRSSRSMRHWHSCARRGTLEHLQQRWLTISKKEDWNSKLTKKRKLTKRKEGIKVVSNSSIQSNHRRK